MTVKVNERYETAFKFLDLIEIVFDGGCVADTKNWHRMVNRVLDIALTAIGDVKNNFRVGCK